MPVDGKLMQLRAAQMNLLRMRGIDFKTVMGIYGKYEKGIPVPPDEASFYDQAIRILIQNNSADSYLSQYYHPSPEEAAAKARKASPGSTVPPGGLRQVAERQGGNREDAGRKAPGTDEKREAPAHYGDERKIDLKKYLAITPKTVLVAVIIVVVLALAWSFGGGGKTKQQPKSPVNTEVKQQVPGKTRSR